MYTKLLPPLLTGVLFPNFYTFHILDFWIFTTGFLVFVFSLSENVLIWTQLAINMSNDLPVNTIRISYQDFSSDFIEWDKMENSILAGNKSNFTILAVYSVYLQNVFWWNVDRSKRFPFTVEKYCTIRVWWWMNMIQFNYASQYNFNEFQSEKSQCVHISSDNCVLI